jgi:hypothetical protein
MPMHFRKEAASGREPRFPDGRSGCWGGGLVAVATATSPQATWRST